MEGRYDTRNWRRTLFIETRPFYDDTKPVTSDIPSDDDDDKPPKCLSTCFSSYAHLNQSLSAVL